MNVQDAKDAPIRIPTRTKQMWVGAFVLGLVVLTLGLVWKGPLSPERNRSSVQAAQSSPSGTTTPPSGTTTPTMAPTIEKSMAPTSTNSMGSSEFPCGSVSVRGGPNDTIVPQRPDLMSLTNSSATTVDIATGRATVQIRLEVQVGVSGEVYLTLDAAQRTTSDHLTIFAIPLNHVTPGDIVTYDLILDVPPQQRNGRYYYTVFLYGRDDESTIYSPANLTDRNWPSSFTVVNTKPDRTPPQLLSLAAWTSTIVTVAPSSKLAPVVGLTFTAYDNGTTLSTARVMAVSNTTTATLSVTNVGTVPPSVPIPVADAVQPVSTRDDVSRGVIYTYNVTVHVPPGTLPGAYALELELGDTAGNIIAYDSAALARRHWPSIIQVQYPDWYDSVPPVLQNSTVSLRTVNVTDAPATLDVQLVVRDNGSGLARGEVELVPAEERGICIFSPHNGDLGGACIEYCGASYRSYVAFDANDTFPVSNATPNEHVSDAAALVFHLRLVVPRYIEPGRYYLRVLLEDVTGNRNVTETSSDLTVQNAVPDTTIPVLLNVTILTPVAPAPLPGDDLVVAVELTLQDDESGIAYWDVNLSGPGGSSDNSLPYRTVFETNHAVLRGVTTVRTNVTIASNNAGTWVGDYHLSVSLMDAVYHATSYGPVQLQYRGFPDVVRVVDRN